MFPSGGDYEQIWDTRNNFLKINASIQCFNKYPNFYQILVKYSLRIEIFPSNWNFLLLNPRCFIIKQCIHLIAKNFYLGAKRNAENQFRWVSDGAAIDLEVIGEQYEDALETMAANPHECMVAVKEPNFGLSDKACTGKFLGVCQLVACMAFHFLSISFRVVKYLRMHFLHTFHTSVGIGKLNITGPLFKCRKRLSSLWFFLNCFQFRWTYL